MALALKHYSKYNIYYSKIISHVKFYVKANIGPYICFLVKTYMNITNS